MTGFERVRRVFADNFEQRGELGAACSVHIGGHPVVDLWGGVTEQTRGNTYTGDTLQMVMSTTKGVVAIAAHMLAQDGLLDFEVPVANYWPEFAAQGKGEIRVR